MAVEVGIVSAAPRGVAHRLRATAAAIDANNWSAQFTLGDSLVAAIAAGTTSQ